ncbi:TIR domain-containing protein [Caballeronia novacaledonica]|uniref:TIR domain-containing protein n=1 Tax=Caballeronia novacaledonica TaxID=1544861 RepID=A0ACB5QUQ5_9BURK|nr:TIR domain-containing protein [Caballeronia novacaledonica]
MARLFISHSSADNAIALALASWLEANGSRDYFLDIDNDRGIAPGERWPATLTGALNRCEAVICILSPAWRKSEHCSYEFHAADGLGKRIFGVIVEGIHRSQLPVQMTAEWQVWDLTTPDDPVSITVAKSPLVSETIVYFPRAGLAALARGLQKAGLDASSFLWPPDGQRDRSPYPGLRALEEVDAAVFFGREASIARAIDQIRRLRKLNVEHLFVVLGASGAGKSSFLRAGLLPRLKRESEHFIVFPAIRPGSAAISGSQGLLNSLKGALAECGLSMSAADVRDELRSVSLGGVLMRIQCAVQRTDRSPEPTLIVPIDQAEELLASDGEDEAQQFFDYVDALRTHLSPTELPDASGQRLRLLFVITIRSDSLPRLQAVDALQALSPVLFSLPAIPVTEFKSVIEGPANLHSKTVKPLVITPQLTEELVAASMGADALPLLALTLEWLYRNFTNDKGTYVGHEEYKLLGGVRGVIGIAVKRAFEQSDSAPAIPTQRQEQERLLKQIFPYIATVDPDTGDWKRRVALRATMRRELPQADALVSRLTEQRLLVTDSRREADGAEPVEVVEVAHEALLRQWDTLERWLREFATDLSASESIRRSAKDWFRNNFDDALLVHATHRLQEAEALLEDERMGGRFESIERKYVAACRARHRRELEEREDQLRSIAEQQAARAALQRHVTWGLSAATAVVMGLLVWIVMQTREVSLQTSLALAGAAEAAADQKRFNQALRLGMLAAKASWLRPAHATAAPALSRAADASKLRALFIGHTGGVLSARFSADGNRVVTASSDGTARVWDADTGKPVGAPMKHGDVVKSSSFSADGKRVVTASEDKTARVWDAGTGKPVGEPMKHGDVVNSSSFSADGKRVVTASEDKTARVWDAGTGKPLGEPVKHDGPVYSASFSADGKRVVTASWDKTARVWDADTGKPVGEPMTHDAPVISVSFSADGKRVVTASEDETARIWDADTGKPEGEPMNHDGPVNSVSFSADGKRVVTASSDGAARIWDADTGKPVGKPMKHDKPIYSASFSADGKRVVTASEDKTARVWDADTGKPVGEPIKHDESVYSASFSADGKRVVTASWDKTARVCDTDTGKPVGEPMKHGDVVNSSSFSADGKRVVTASWDETARVWDAGTGKPVGEPMKHGDVVNSSSFSADGKRVVTASEDKTARVWDAGTGKPLGEPVKHDGPVYSASFSADGKRVVTASWDKTARVWDADTGKPVGEPMTHDAPVISVSFSADGKRVVTASEDETARIWDADTGKPEGEPMKHDGPVNSVSFSADGKRVVTASSDGAARIWDADTGKPVGEPMEHDGPIYSASFSADGKRVVTASKDKTARVWDADTGTPVGAPMTHDASVYSASFSADGKRVVTASEDKTARVWDADTGKPVGAPMTHDAPVNSASFSADGKRVVTASEDKTARVWDDFWSSLVRPENLMKEVCQRQLRGSVRALTEEDIAAVRILSPKRVGENVCDGVAVPTR